MTGRGVIVLGACVCGGHERQAQRRAVATGGYGGAFAVYMDDR